MLFGGAGKDLLVAGAGDDYLLGDNQWRPINLDWTVTPDARSPFAPGFLIYNDDDSQPNTIRDGGADILYAGYGNDYLHGGQGAISSTPKRATISPSAAVAMT